MKTLYIIIVLVAVLFVATSSVVLACGPGQNCPTKYKCTGRLVCKTTMLNGRTRRVFYGGSVYGPNGGGLSTNPYGRGWKRVQ